MRFSTLSTVGGTSQILVGSLRRGSCSLCHPTLKLQTLNSKIAKDRKRGRGQAVYLKTYGQLLFTTKADQINGSYNREKNSRRKDEAVKE